VRPVSLATRSPDATAPGMHWLRQMFGRWHDVRFVPDERHVCWLVVLRMLLTGKGRQVLRASVGSVRIACCDTKHQAAVLRVPGGGA